MTRFELWGWYGRFHDRRVIELIRSKIRRRIQEGGCVLVDLDYVSGLTPAGLARLTEGWPDAQAKFCGCAEVLPFPLPPDVRPSFATGL